MADGWLEDHYALLGIARVASDQEVRQAYRQLALRHHPDVAGTGSTAAFQRLVAAYRVLSDPLARAAYDERLRGGRADDHGPAATNHAAPRPQPTPPADLLERLARPLDELVERQVARRCSDGVIELSLTDGEGETGGVLAFHAVVRIPCPTCGGLAEPEAIWCSRCRHEGTILDEITVRIAVPPYAPDGMIFSVEIDRSGVVPPLRVRLRVPRW